MPPQVSLKNTHKNWTNYLKTLKKPPEKIQKDILGVSMDSYPNEKPTLKDYQRKLEELSEENLNKLCQNLQINVDNVNKDDKIQSLIRENVKNTQGITYNSNKSPYIKNIVFNLY